MRIKKLLSIFLALSMLLVWMPVTASAEQGVIASGICGDNLTWVLTVAGTLNISGTGEMDNYFYDDVPPWYEQRESIYEIVIESGVTTIGEFAFNKCTNLSNVVIPDTITYIPMAAFYNCAHLSDITIPNSVTYIGIDAFKNCTSLSDIVIPASVTMIDLNPFSGATNLQRITVDSANKVYKDIDGVLYYKTGDTILAFPGGKGGSYTIPEGVRGATPTAFARCSNITDITIPASFGEIYPSTFSGCSGLKAINVTPGNQYYYSHEGVVFSYDNILFAFPGGRSGSYTIPDGITVVGESAFAEAQLTSVTIPEGVTDIENHAFSNCSNLETVTIANTVRRIGIRAFSNCSNLTDVVFLGNAPSMYGWEEGSFYNVAATVRYPEDDETWTDKIDRDYGGELTWVPVSPYKHVITGFIERLTLAVDDTVMYSFTPDASGLYIFYMTNITYPGASPDSYTFSPNLRIYDDGVSVEEEAWMHDISANEAVVCNMEAGHTYLLEVANDSYWSQLLEADFFIEEVSMPDSIAISGNAQILEGSFEEYYINVIDGFPFVSGKTVWSVSDNSVLTIEDSYLSSAYIRALDYGTVTITATLENGVSASFEVTVTDTLEGQCGDNASFTINDEGTLIISGTGATWDYSTDDSGEWWGNYPDVPWDRQMVKTVIVESGITRIGNALFNNCDNLTSVSLPEGLTSIGGRAFIFCGSLTTITIPKEVTYIGTVALSGCYELSSVYFLGDAPSTNPEYTLLSSYYSDLTVYYPNRNNTWTEDVMDRLGEDVIWIAYDPCASGHHYESSVTAPTCTTEGYTTYTCTKCGDSYVDDFTEKNDHFFENGRCSHCGAFGSVHIWGQGDTYPIEIRVYGETSIEAVYVDGEAVEFQCSFNEEWYFLAVSIDTEYLNTLPLGEYEIKILLPDGTEYYVGLEVCESEWINLEPNCSYTVTDWSTYRYTCPQDGIAGFSIDAGADWLYSVCILDTAGDYHIIIDSSVEPMTAAEFDVAAGEQIWIAVVPANGTAIGTAEFLFTYGPKEPEHDHSYEAEVTEPTCTTEGYTTYTCTECGESYVDDHVPALGHDYEAVVTPPTYESQGFTTHTCTRCGESYVDSYVEPLIRYDVLEGDNAQWSGESEAPVAVRVDADITIFVEVRINGAVVDPSNYTVTQGSTIVTLKPEYLASLPAGDYAMEVVFTDGIAEAAFQIASAISLGDVNGDDTIDTTDAYLIVLYYNERMELDETQLAAADVNNDGSVDTTDAYYIVLFYNERIDSFPT